MEKFEYKILEIKLNDGSDRESCLDFFNNLGKDGWELVNVISNIGLGSNKYSIIGINNNQLAVLKRKISENNNH